MNTRLITPFSFSALGLSLLMLSGGASANGYWHPTNNETGVTVHPSHLTSNKTREQVRAEAVEARRNGEMWHVTESGERPRAPQHMKSQEDKVSAFSQQEVSE